MSRVERAIEYVMNKMNPMNDENLRFIRQGRTGCVFATILSRDPDKIGWSRIVNPTELMIPEDAYMISYIFEGKTKDEVTQWALDNGMYFEQTSKRSKGLRYKNEHGVSWVQYFGPDSHVKTRQSPVAELLFTVKLPKKSYVKVGFNGILHLAHASVAHLKENTLDRIWDACFHRTKKILGHSPTVMEAAKTSHVIPRRVLFIGQAPPLQEQVLPYDTTQLWNWFKDIGLMEFQVLQMSTFDAMTDQPPELNKAGGHKAPKKAEMTRYHQVKLKGLIEEHTDIILLGKCPMKFFGIEEFYVSKDVGGRTWHTLIHPSSRNIKRYRDDKDQIQAVLKRVFNEDSES
jgi:uracil-DNA glycosylase